MSNTATFIDIILVVAFFFLFGGFIYLLLFNNLTLCLYIILLYFNLAYETYSHSCNPIYLILNKRDNDFDIK
jgi:uncharacterized membrane protein